MSASKVSAVEQPPLTEPKEEIRLGVDDDHDVNEEQSEPEPAEPLTPGEPAAGGRQARPANTAAEATQPGVAEAKPAPGMRA